MELLLLGLLIWASVHFSIRLAPGVRQTLIDRLGRWPYMGVFSLAMLGGIYCLVLGWKDLGAGAPLYVFDWARPVSLVLMAVAASLFVAANAPTDIKRVMRHPQLTSVVLWSAAHLLSNGDLRSLVLFGGLAIWAVGEMALINLTAGPWQKPAPFGAGKTVVSLVIGLAVFAGLYVAHPWLSGVPLN
ncbi:NnrU family protein [Litorivivens sp.]|uniref:NnrU family protein n=1 Tax=Litorivivens sp. TaxID=2020868 RepID=UPI0035627F58